MKTIASVLLAGIFGLGIVNLSAQDAPISKIGSVETYSDSAIVTITVSDFTNISVCDLTLSYDHEKVAVTSVTEAPGVISVFFIPDFTQPGTILISWFYFQGLTLPDDSAFMNITFERLDYGASAIEFDNSLPNNCLWTDNNAIILNDTPFSTYYIDGSINFKMIDAPITATPTIENCPGLSVVDIPVTVSEFSQIGSFTLTMQYDATVFAYQSFTNISGFPNLDILESSPGIIVAEGITSAPQGMTVANNSVLFTIHFDNLGGSTDFSWLDTGESCIYHGQAPMYEPRNDIPQSSFYTNGSFTELPLPSAAGSITGPPGGDICQGESVVVFSVPPIPNATGYEWELPDGAVIESGAGTSEIIVLFNNNAQNGNVSVFGTNDCGNGPVSPAFPITINSAPSIETQPVSPDTVIADEGSAIFSLTATGDALSYQWQEYTTSWSDIMEGTVYSGVNTSQLTITNPPLSMNGNKYRCIVSGICEPEAITNGNATLWVVVPTGFNFRNLKGDQGTSGLKVKLFPNPFADQMTLTFDVPSKGTVNFEITNMYGEKVAKMTKPINSKGNHEFPINVEYLRKGIYLATLTFYNNQLIERYTLNIISNN